MIELNLLERKAPLKLPIVLGVDLNTLNFKLLGLAFVVYYVPGIYYESEWDAEIAKTQEENQSLVVQEQQIQSELGDKGDIREQLDGYNKQVEKLKERSLQVDAILKERSNPRAVLEKIARSMSDEIWIDNLSLTSNKELLIIGGAYTPQGTASYRVIGQFVNLLNDSPFFNGTVTISSQNQQESEIDGIKLMHDKFEVKAQVKNFDAFIR